MQPPPRTSSSNSQFLILLLTLSVFIFILGKTPVGHIYFTASGWALTPVQKLVYKTGNRVGRDIDFWTTMRRLSQRDRALRLQYAQVVSENAKYQTLARENEALKSQLTTFGAGSNKQIETQVAAIAPDMKISSGSNSGIRSGDAVVLGNWLIGQVVIVEANSAVVKLTTSPDLKLSVATTGDAKGVSVGQFNASILLDKVLPSERLDEGDLVLTTGDNPGIPKGLVVGKIVATDKNNAEIFQTARVEPLASFGDLDNVFVVEGPR